MNELICVIETTHRHKEQGCSCQGGGGRAGEGWIGSLGLADASCYTENG